MLEMEEKATFINRIKQGPCSTEPSPFPQSHSSTPLRPQLSTTNLASYHRQSLPRTLTRAWYTHSLFFKRYLSLLEIIDIYLHHTLARR